MRKVAVLLTVTALALTAGAALAGDYHVKETLICADCHNMHYSIKHGFDGGTPSTLGSSGPYHYLLVNDPNDMCLRCHDGQSDAPDVYAANTGTHVRQAGALSKLGDTGDWAAYKGHTLNSTAVAPGGTWSHEVGLECIDCHHQHAKSAGTSAYPAGYANGQYRNLNPQPGTAAAVVPLTYKKGGANDDLTLAIYEHDATLGQIDVHYSYDNVDFNEPDTHGSAYAAWCMGCHTDFHGAKGDANMGGDASGWSWLRHPTADINIAGQTDHGHTKASGWKATGKVNFVKVMDAAGLWAHASDPTADADLAAKGYTPSCFTCHMAHGNKNPFGLIQMAGTGTITEEGTSGGTEIAKTLCKQCHGQG